VNEVVLEVAAPECAAEDFEGEIIAMHLDTGMYFSMADTAAIIWRDLTAGHSAESLIRLAGSNKELSNAVERFVTELVNAGLVRKAAVAPRTLGPAKFAAAVADSAAVPVLEAFGDMKKLLLLDPVHEVDGKAGWPEAKAPKDS
jgi:Coenzyme PQQ synthesis protein D (PqqD)